MGNCLQAPRDSRNKNQNAGPDNVELNAICIDSDDSRRHTVSNHHQLPSTESDDLTKIMQNLQRHKRSISRFKEQQSPVSNEEIVSIKRNNSIRYNGLHRASSTADRMIQSRRRHKRTISRFKEEQFKQRIEAYGCQKVTEHNKTQFSSIVGDAVVGDAVVDDAVINTTKAKYIQNTDTGHLSLIIFDETIDLNDDMYDEGHFIIDTPHGDDIDGDAGNRAVVVRVIHIYIDETQIVRLESKQWKKLKKTNKIINNEEYPIYKSLAEIVEWCVMRKNNYSDNKNFVMELGSFLNITVGKENNETNTLLNEIGEQKEDSVHADQWACSKCTFLNHIALANCEICREPVPVTYVM